MLYEVITAYKTFLEALFSLSCEARTEMTALLRLASEGFHGEASWDTVRSLIEVYPDDPGLLSPLYLNVIDLEPGEALFLPAGVLHAYVKGFAVELMASRITSYNVCYTKLLRFPKSPDRSLTSRIYLEKVEPIGNILILIALSLSSSVKRPNRSIIETSLLFVDS